MELTFVSDNGVWNHKRGEYAVNGDYQNHHHALYYHSASEALESPLLLLAIERGAAVERVQIKQRFEAAPAGSQI